MKSHRLLAALASMALLLSATAGSALAAKPTGVGIQKTEKVQKVGTTRISGGGQVSQASSFAGEFRPSPEAAIEDLDKFIRNPISQARVPSAFVPRPAVQDVVAASGTTAFGGLNHFDQRTSGTGAYTNTQFSLEPPDQALCVSDDWVVESVNTVVRVKTKIGANATAVMPLNDFFNLAPEIIRATPLVFGDFTSDPKCYYDTDTDRWFLTILQLDIDPPTGNFTGGTSVQLAVSQTGDPTGVWNLFKIDTTNDGEIGGNCPCLGDQPLIGADANGFYISTNVFPLFEPGFNGAMVYAMSKTALAGGATGTVVSIFQPTLAEGQAYSLQPATTPPGAAYATENGGTEYFLSALEFTGGLDNRIALWSLTNTASLSNVSPSVTMQVKVLGSEVYGLPPVMIQKDGLTPFRDLIRSKLAPAVLGINPTTEHLNLLNSNDDRMNQTVYVDGQIWGALNTVVKSPTGATRTAIAWFAVTPSWSGSTLGGAVSSQGYVAVQNNSLSFPAVAANADGDVLVAFSLTGPDFYPSAAFAWLDPESGAGDVQVAAWGVGPADGFTGYVSIAGGSGVERWGDYSAAVADADGDIWIATESINQSCSLNTALSTGFTCGGTRTIFANWGTTIAKVVP